MFDKSFIPECPWYGERPHIRIKTNLWPYETLKKLKIKQVKGVMPI